MEYITKEYINFVQISPAAIETQGVRIGDLAVPVNNTHLCAMCLSWPLTHDYVSWLFVL